MTSSINFEPIAASKMEITAKPPGWKGGIFIPSRYFSAVKYNAARRGIGFSLTLYYLDNLWLTQQGKCAYTGRDLVLPTKKDSGTASLDRIDSSCGYEEENVQFVHKNINYMKYNMSEVDFLEFVQEISKYRGV